MMKRHFKIYVDSDYLSSIVVPLLKQNGVTFTFKKDKFRNSSYEGKLVKYKIGEYDVYVDDSIYNDDTVFELLKDYELVEISKNYFDWLCDKKAQRSYAELCQKYKVIEEERDKYADEKLKEQRHEILKDTLSYYKTDIEVKIQKEVKYRYEDLFERFHNEKCPIDEVCELYRKYIEAEIKMHIVELKEKVLKFMRDNKETRTYQYNDNLEKLSNELLSLNHIMPSCDDVHKDIKAFKNKVVDGIMETSGHTRLSRDYWHYMKAAGRLADLIENKLWEYFLLSQYK